MSLVRHRKAKGDYEILDTFEAGVELLGYEVKSLKEGHATLEGAYASLTDGEAFLRGLHISPYQTNNTPPSHDPDRSRKLLLKKSEIRELSQKLSQKGLTLIPLSLYNKGRKIKVELALVRGKKKYDKRETIKKRDTERDLERTLKTKF
jgi:SsrA-binding protein